MLSNAYFVAKFGFDTAENEPEKKLENLQKKIANFPNFADPNPLYPKQVSPRDLVEPLSSVPGGHLSIAPSTARHASGRLLSTYVFSNCLIFF